MRISNIAQYLGGADNVIVKEITVGDSFNQRVTTADVGGDNIRFDAAKWDINFALYKATVAPRGSSITITDFQQQGTPISTVDLTDGDGVIGQYIQDPTDGRFDIRIRPDLLSQFETAHSTTYTPVADATNPFVVVQTVRFEASATDPIIAGEIRSLRFMWIVRYTPLANNA